MMERPLPMTFSAASSSILPSFPSHVINHLCCVHPALCTLFLPSITVKWVEIGQRWNQRPWHLGHMTGSHLGGCVLRWVPRYPEQWCCDINRSRQSFRDSRLTLWGLGDKTHVTIHDKYRFKVGMVDMAKTGGGGLKSGLKQNGTGKPVRLSGRLDFFRLYLNFPLGGVSDPPGISPGLITWLCEERKFALSSQAISKWIEISSFLKFIMSPKDRKPPPPASANGICEPFHWLSGSPLPADLLPLWRCCRTHSFAMTQIVCSILLCNK